jgi:hypothetical protein
MSVTVPSKTAKAAERAESCDSWTHSQARNKPDRQNSKAANLQIIA